MSYAFPGTFPGRRMRRVRRHDFSRRLVAENQLTVSRSDLSGICDGGDQPAASRPFNAGCFAYDDRSASERS